MTTAPQNASPEHAAMAAALQVIGTVEPTIADAIRGELHNQRSQLKLIASENYASPATLLAMGNWFSDKYAEGTVGHRFYAGCEYVDIVEARASELACQLFGAQHAYVQPHSGIDANLVAFWSILARQVEAPALAELGAKHVNDLTDDQWETLRRSLGNQRMLGMSLDAGGHLTHGFRPNISGKLFDQRSYGTDPVTGLLDYAEVRRLAQEFRPLVIVAGYSAYPRRVNFATMREIADEVGAVLMVDMAHFAGLVAGGAHPSPVPFADVVTTTTHKSLRGPRGAMILCREAHAAKIDKAVFPGLQGGPHNAITAAIAVNLQEAVQPAFADYAQACVRNAQTLAATLMTHGFKLVTDGTDNHLMLIDLRNKGLGGKAVAQALDRAGLVANYNAVPWDERKPQDPSGLRLGSPAMTTRGFGESEFRQVGEWIAQVITSGLDAACIDRIAGEVRSLSHAFPMP